MLKSRFCGGFFPLSPFHGGSERGFIWAVTEMGLAHRDLWCVHSYGGVHINIDMHVSTKMCT